MVLHHRSLNPLRFYFTLFFVALLSACGGSGGSGNSGGSGGSGTVPQAPESAPSLAFEATKIFTLSWDAVPGATHYRLFESPNDVSGYSAIGGDLTSPEYRHIAALHQRAEASYLVQACNDQGCSADSDAVFVTAALNDAIGYMKASNTGGNDFFGTAVAVSGDGKTVAVGADGEGSSATGVNGNQNDNSLVLAGAVYVFARDNNGVWTQQAYIKASNPDGSDLFGAAVTLSDDGNTLAVGASREDSPATGINGNQVDNTANEAGAVYVFTRQSSVWSQQAYIKPSNTGAGSLFGGAVSLSGDGNTLAVGAAFEDTGQTNAGAVYVFTRANAVWSEQALLQASNAGNNDRFGRAVDLSAEGNRLAVGAYLEDSGSAGVNGDESDDAMADAGAVYVFELSAGSWGQTTYLKASNPDPSDFFGAAVALSADGTTLAVGAYGEASSATGVNNTAGEALNDSMLAGAVYVFVDEGGVWAQKAYIKASNTGASDLFGDDLALSGDGNTLAVAADFEEGGGKGINADGDNNDAFDSGAVYVYTRNGVEWAHQAYVKAPNTESSDTLGLSLGLSSDGETLVVGASGEDSSATGLNGDQDNNDVVGSGAVYLY